MEIDFTKIPPIERYRFLTSVVVPRPIAWVTTIDDAGLVNAAPFSFFNVFGSNPAIVALGIGNRKNGDPKDTARNIEATGEFVINSVTESLAARMAQTSFEYDAEVNELEAVGLSISPSLAVAPPRIAESPTHLECRKRSIQEIGSNRLIIGEVVHAAVDDAFYDSKSRMARAEKVQPIGRMHAANGYTRTRDLLYMERPEKP